MAPDRNTPAADHISQRRKGPSRRALRRENKQLRDTVANLQGMSCYRAASLY
jgi:hypothetical protein